MSGTGEESFPQLVSRVVDDAKELARAEVALARVQVAANVARYRAAVLLCCTALALVIAAIVAAAVGALFSLSALVGVPVATLIVCATLLVCAGLCSRLAVSRFKRKWIAPVPGELE